MEKELKNIPLLVSLSDAERKELVKYFAREGSYATGESLMISGGQESDVFFLLKGKVRISLSSTHGDLISYREIMPYDYFGWLSALDGAARLTSAVALEDSTALKVTAKDFKTILLAHPAIHDNFMLRLAGVVREYTERIHGLTALSARQRILGALMRRFVDYQTPIDIGSHEDFASWAGTTRETVTRNLLALENEGIVQKTGNSYRLLKIPDEVNDGAILCI